MIASPRLAEQQQAPAAAKMRTLSLDANVYASLTEALQLPDPSQDPPSAAPDEKLPDPSTLPPIENLRVIPWDHGTPIV